MAATTTEEAAATSSTPRERGTLKHTLPRRPIFLIGLVWAASATLATKLSLHSLPSVYDTSWQLFFVVASLGSASALVGIVFGDSLSHSLAFGTALLIARYCSGASIVEASPPLVVAAMASFRGTHAMISCLDGEFIFSSTTLHACCLIPFLTVVYLLIASEFKVKATGLFSTSPTCTVSFIIIALLHYYNKNRAHKHGYLLTSEMKSHAVFVANAIILSASLMTQDESFSIVIVVFLLGSMFALLMSVFFAGVADSWYAVGSGQFQMVSLDSAGMMIYFFWPAIIIFFRFVDKYGDYIGGKSITAVGYLKSAGLLTDSPLRSEDDIFSFSFVIMLAMITAVGVPSLNALCPMGGYLYSRAYTHGQPNTKQVALCVSYSDLPKDRTTLFAMLADKKKEGQATVVLNIFVTLEDLKMHPSELKLIAAKGHKISLEPTEFIGLNFLQKTTATCNIEFAHYEYSEVLGESPAWLLAKSVNTIGRHPSLLHKASDLGMKVVYWSTLVKVSSGKLTARQKDAIVGDCKDKNGGSIIYVTSDNSASNLTAPLCEVVGLLHEFTFESLSTVARDDPTMVL
ncbi:hypothetical protein ACHAXM_001498 [Skeletonema potamos]